MTLECSNWSRHQKAQTERPCRHDAERPFPGAIQDHCGKGNLHQIEKAEGIGCSAGHRENQGEAKRVEKKQRTNDVLDVTLQPLVPMPKHSIGCELDADCGCQ